MWEPDVKFTVSQWYVYPRDMCIPAHISLLISVSLQIWRPGICVFPTSLPSLFCRWLSPCENVAMNLFFQQQLPRRGQLNIPNYDTRVKEQFLIVYLKANMWIHPIPLVSHSSLSSRKKTYLHHCACNPRRRRKRRLTNWTNITKLAIGNRTFTSMLCTYTLPRFVHTSLACQSIYNNQVIILNCTTG